MILTLLWKWLRDLWRDAHPAPVPESEAASDFRNRSDDQNKSSVGVFEDDGPQPAA